MKLMPPLAALLPALGPCLLLFVLLATPQVTVGCAPAFSASTTPAPSSISTSPAGYSIAVFLNDKQMALLTPADLAKLPQVKATVAGAQEQGPTLLSALSLAGIKDFTQVTAYGFSKGRVATAELTLTRDRVTDNAMLALVARGTVKLTGTDIGWWLNPMGQCRL